MPEEPISDKDQVLKVGPVPKEKASLLLVHGTEDEEVPHLMQYSLGCLPGPSA